MACFGSPESIKQWLHNVGVSLGTVGSTEEEKRATGNGDAMAACIGIDTASTCLKKETKRTTTTLKVTRRLGSSLFPRRISSH